MPYTQHFFLGREYYGSTKREAFTRLGEVWVPYGYAFFCPVCIEIWARCPIEGELTHPVQRWCGKHALGEVFGRGGPVRTCDMHDWAGHLWLASDQRFSLSLPEPLLQREIDLLAPGWLK